MEMVGIWSNAISRNTLERNQMKSGLIEAQWNIEEDEEEKYLISYVIDVL